MADHDRDLVRLYPASQQPGDLDPDRFGLAASARGVQQHDPVVGIDRQCRRLEQVAVEMAQRRALCVAGIERQRLGPFGAELLDQTREQARAGRERAGVGVGDRDRDLCFCGQGRDQLRLVAPQVVEAVDEDGSAAPGGPIGAQRGDRGRGDRAMVRAAAGVAKLGVGAVDRCELELVCRVVELADDSFELVGFDQCSLQFGDEPVGRRREARTIRAAAQPARRGAANRGAHKRLALGRREPRPEVDGERRGHLASEPVEGRDRAADGGRALSAEVALEGRHVVGGWHYEQRPAAELVAKTRDQRRANGRNSAAPGSVRSPSPEHRSGCGRQT